MPGIPEIRRLTAISELKPKTEKSWIEFRRLLGSAVHYEGLMQSLDLLARTHSTRQLEARRERSHAQQPDGNLSATRQHPIQRYDDPSFVIRRPNPGRLGRRLLGRRHGGKLEERHPRMLDGPAVLASSVAGRRHRLLRIARLRPPAYLGANGITWR
jgi:hypothetical protein